MNFRLCTGLAAFVCLSMASCYPYNENPLKRNTQKAPPKTELTAAQLKQKRIDSEKKKATDEGIKKTNNTSRDTPAENPGTVNPQPDTPKPTEQKRSDYSFANKVPGKDGFVFSPYNNKVVDVRDIPSGTLVQDPTYPAAEKKYFRVP